MKRRLWCMRKAGGGTGAMISGLILGIALITIAVAVAIKIGAVLYDNSNVFVDAAKNMFQ